MNFDLKTLGLPAATTEKCDLLVLLVTEGMPAGKDALSTLAAQALKSGDLEAKPGKNLALYQVEGIAARRVLLLGAGNGDARSVQRALQGAAATLRAPSIKRAVVCFGVAAMPEAVAAVVETVMHASYVYTTTKPKADARALGRVVVGVADAEADDVVDAFERSCAVAQGVEFAREWGNRPANHATPSLLAEAARTLAEHARIQCKVMGPAEVAKLGMGAFLAVAQGAAEPLRLIELRYNGAAKHQAPVVLVGKGITFDTGGISIKPSAEMDEMKYDMCGAASVLGVFRALAELQPEINVVGLIPACENMPDGKAIKPGDVVTSMSGQTIEILNTDAEGRLVLCDAITYAARYKPTVLIDIATLTGACVIALGGVRSGLFAPDDGLASDLHAAGEAAQDGCWRMPLDEEYGESLKSNFADVGNVGGRPAGSVTAAKFLQRFVGNYLWAHLDIAGTAWKGGAAKGATGRPVGLLVQYLLGQADKARKTAGGAEMPPVSKAAAPAAKKAVAHKPHAKEAAARKG